MSAVWNKLFSAVRDLAAEEKAPPLSPRQRAQQSEMENAVLVLAAEVIRCDMNYTHDTEQLVMQFFSRQFGAVGKAYRQQSLLRHLEEGTEPLLRIAARQLKMLAIYDSRLTVLQFLFAVANADDYVNERELKRLHRIGNYLGVKETDYASIKHELLAQHNPFVLLGVAESATAAELKKAYRAKVLQYHPDKRAANVSEQEAAAAFVKLKRAYELAKARLAD